MAEETDSRSSSDFPKVTELVRDRTAMTSTCFSSSSIYLLLVILSNYEMSKCSEEMEGKAGG